jgi:exonuclease VII large subunit
MSVSQPPLPKLARSLVDALRDARENESKLKSSLANKSAENETNIQALQQCKTALARAMDANIAMRKELKEKQDAIATAVAENVALKTERDSMLEIAKQGSSELLANIKLAEAENSRLTSRLEEMLHEQAEMKSLLSEGWSMVSADE